MCDATHSSSSAYSANTNGWFVGSSLPGCKVVDTRKITIPTRNAIEPIRSIGRSKSGVLLATIVRQLRRLAYYSCEAIVLELYLFVSKTALRWLIFDE